MLRRLQAKIITFIIGMVLIPVLIISSLFLTKYNSFMNNNKYKYIEVIRINGVSALKEKFKTLGEQLEKLEKSVIQNEDSSKSDNLDNLLSKEERIQLSSIEGFQNSYLFDTNFNLSYKVFESTEIVPEIIKSIENEVINNIIFKNLIFKGNYYNVSVLKMIKDGKVTGYLALVVNNDFFNIDALKINDVIGDIYDNNFNLIKTNSNKKIFVKEINQDTKSMLDGYEKTEVTKASALSYGFIDLAGDDMFFMVNLNNDKYSKSDSFKLYIILGTIFSVIFVFLLGWKLIGLINLYIDKNIENKEYDDYTVNKFKIDLEKNLVNIDRIVDNITDFQVLKQDLEKLKERFSEGSATDDTRTKK